MELYDKLIHERENKLSGGLYYWSQILFSYNSNHMEGSQLTEDQTRQIFDSGTVLTDKNEVIRVNDVIETANHFRLFDYILNTKDTPLSEEYLFTLQKILKKGTSNEDDPLMNVGGFKKIPNVIGNLSEVTTSDPQDVEKDIRLLLENWEKSSNKRKLEVYAKLHFEFESIHPFSDGNGRVGRVVLFKELLRNDQIPLIVRDENKPFYIRGLREYKNQPGYLNDTLGLEQDYYHALYKKFYPVFQQEKSKMKPKPKKPKR